MINLQLLALKQAMSRYRVDTLLGQVFRLDGRPMRHQIGAHGYEVVTFSVKGFRAKGVTIPVHKVIAYCLWGDTAFAQGTDVRHLDNDKRNNQASNLALGTRAENMLDSPPEVRMRGPRASALVVQGVPNVNRALTDEEVKEIREALDPPNYRRGMVTELAEQFHVSHTTISNIKTRRSYPNVA